MKRFVLAITGASGAVFGLRVLTELLRSAEVHIVLSSQSLSILKDETGSDWSGSTEDETERKIRRHFSTERIFYWANDNMEAPISSGSFRTDGMLVAPCSMKTLSGIANGYANNLIERAADVALKEGRMLLLSPRETPLNAIHLENMLKLARLGVRIVPPMPAFYHKPGRLDDIVDFAAGKILDAAGVEHNIFKRWEGRRR